MSVKEMAYGGKERRRTQESDFTYRLERAFPYMRAGRNVVASPGFKALTLYSHTTTNAPSYGIAATGSTIKLPEPPTGI